MEHPISVANFFLKKSLESGQLLTPMKLVKLVYMAHGWYLGLTGLPLLTESAEAWKYGPVVPSVYYSFKSYGGKPITQLAYTVTPSGQLSYYPLTEPGLTEFLERVWHVYKDYSGIELSAMTHQEDTPWHTTWHRQGGKDQQHIPILNPAIRAHYEQLAAANTNAHAA